MSSTGQVKAGEFQGHGTMAVRKKVLFQQPILAPYRLKAFQELANHPDFDVTFVYGQAMAGSGLQSLTDEKSIKTRIVENVYIGHGKVRYQRGLLQAFHEIKPDIVVIPLNPRNLSLWPLELAARRAGCRIVRWGHGIRPRGRFKHLYARMAQRADATVCYYNEGADALVALGVDRRKVSAAWNSIDTCRIAEVRDSSYTEQRDTIISIGRLVPQKRPMLLLEVAKMFKQSGRTEKFVFVGGGPETSKMEAFIAENELQDTVTIRQETYDESEIAEVFNRSAVCACPGQVGLNGIHAMAYGVPVLYADAEEHGPEIETVKAGDWSRPFAAGDAQSLHDELVKMLGSKSEWVVQSQLAMEHINKNFSAQTMAENLAKAMRGTEGAAPLLMMLGSLLIEK